MTELKKKCYSNYYDFIDIVKVIAVILIINSHMDPIYPIKSLATGGSLGNALFFIASGFLLLGRNKDIKFYFILFFKLYIPLYLVTLITGLEKDVLWIKQLVWPTNYWFIGAIVVFYILYGVLEKLNLFAKISYFYLAILAMYFVVYFTLIDTSKWVVEKAGLYDIESLFKLIYYFGIMIFGGYARYKKKFKISKRNLGILSIVSVVVMYSSKYLMNLIPELMHFQFISQVCTFIFSATFFLLLMNTDLSLNPKIKKIIRLLSSASLEFYLVQFWIISIISQKFIFPFSFVIAIFLIIISGLMFSFFVKNIVERLKRILV